MKAKILPLFKSGAKKLRILFIVPYNESYQLCHAKLNMMYNYCSFEKNYFYDIIDFK